MMRMPSSQVEGPIPWSFKFGRVLPPVHLRHRILVIYSHPSPMGPAMPAFRLVRPFTKIPFPLHLPRYSTQTTTHFAITSLPVFLRHAPQVPHTQVNMCEDHTTICVLWLLVLIVVLQPPNRTVPFFLPYFVFITGNFVFVPVLPHCS